VVGVAGLFLYQAGTIFVNTTYDDYDKAQNVEILAETDRWSVLRPVLTYWHEVDHFYSYFTSPYFFLFDQLFQLYADRFLHLLSQLSSDGLKRLDRPVTLLLLENKLSPTAAWLVRDQIRRRSLIKSLLYAEPNPHQLAAELNNGLEGVRAGKGIRPGSDLANSFPRIKTLASPSSAKSMAFSPVAVLEASAMWHESGNLWMRGVTGARYRQWVNERVTGLYGTILRPLLGRIDFDVLGLLLRLCMRGFVFPLVPGKSAGSTDETPNELALESFHPGAQFERGLRFLADHHLLGPNKGAPRSATAREAFYLHVTEVLQDELAVVKSAEPFQATADFLEGTLFKFDAASSAAPGRQPIAWEREFLQEKRRRAFEEEAAHPENLGRTPLETPLRIVFRDTSIWSPSRLFDKTVEHGAPFLAHDRQALQVGTAERVVFGSSTLLKVLYPILSLATEPEPPPCEELVRALVKNVGIALTGDGWRDLTAIRGLGRV